MRSQERQHMNEKQKRQTNFTNTQTFKIKKKKSDEKHVDAPESNERRNRQMNEDRQTESCGDDRYV